VEEVRQLALKYLGARDRTEWELRDRLRRRQCAAPAIDAVLPDRGQGIAEELRPFRWLDAALRISLRFTR